jgi:lipoprotein-releasing system permease protein
MYFTFAWRYFKAKKSTNAVNIIAWVSVTAIVIGTASLIIILSAFNGFESLVKSLYSSFYTDLRVVPARGKVLTLDDRQLDALADVPGVQAISRVAEERALLQHGEYQAIVQAKGVDANYTRVAGVQEKLIRGHFSVGSAEDPRMVMGSGIENAIGVLSDRALSPVTIYLPRKGMAALDNPLESLSQGFVQPAGCFAIQSEFDNKYVITNLDFLRQYLNYGKDEYSAVEISLQNPGEEEAVKTAMSGILGDQYKVLNKYEQNPGLYATIRLEKWAIFAIFSLILVVAAFNMIGALSMLVLEKKKDIQVLQAMGADRSLVRRIFLAEGLLLAVLGVAGGILVALLLYYLQITYKLVPIQGQSFLIDYYPVKLVFWDFVLVIATVLLIGLLASWFPAARAADQPFELRN